MTVSFIFFAFPIKTSLLLYIRRVVPSREYIAKGCLPVWVPEQVYALSSNPPRTAYVLNLSVVIWFFLLLFTISGCILDAFFCNPPRYVYDIDWVSRLDRAEHCFSNDAQYGMLVYQGSLSFVIDLAIFLLPIPALIQMKVSKGKWLALATVFASGKDLTLVMNIFLGTIVRKRLTIRGECSRCGKYYPYH